MGRWGNIAQRHELDDEPYTPRRTAHKWLATDGVSVGPSFETAYTAKEQDNSRSHAALEPNHSHFVLVDTGKEGRGAWGGEIALRRQVTAHAVARANLLARVRVHRATNA